MKPNQSQIPILQSSKFDVGRSMFDVQPIDVPTRRAFLAGATGALGAMALQSLANADSLVAGRLPNLPHFAPKAKQCVMENPVSLTQTTPINLFSMLEMKLCAL